MSNEICKLVILTILVVSIYISFNSKLMVRNNCHYLLMMWKLIDYMNENTRKVNWQVEQIFLVLALFRKILSSPEQ